MGLMLCHCTPLVINSIVEGHTLTRMHIHTHIHTNTLIQILQVRKQDVDHALASCSIG